MWSSHSDWKIWHSVGFGQLNMKSGQLVKGRVLQSLITLGPGQVKVISWALDKYWRIKQSVNMMHVNPQVRRLPSNSCQHTFSKRDLSTSIKCPVVTVWCLLCSSWEQMFRGQQWVLYFKRIVKKTLTYRRKKKMFHTSQLSGSWW